jgi:hypothetical protein
MDRLDRFRPYLRKVSIRRIIGKFVQIGVEDALVSHPLPLWEGK